MNDCPNVTMREMLPDLLNDRLPAVARAQVQAHVESCADCRAELEVLRRVRSALPAPRIEAAGIAARIAPYRRPSRWVSASRSWPLRAAAAVVLVVGGATLLRQGGTDLNQPDTLIASSAVPGLAVGGLADIPDSDLRALAAELGALQAVTSAEPEVVVPAVGSGSGGGK
jgi:anti-sigma factor RsiW